MLGLERGVQIARVISILAFGYVGAAGIYITAYGLWVMWRPDIVEFVLVGTWALLFGCLFYVSLSLLFSTECKLHFRKNEKLSA